MPNNLMRKKMGLISTKPKAKPGKAVKDNGSVKRTFPAKIRK